PADPPFHVFSNAKKKRLVGIVSLAGLFSPLSSNIYFPALSAISAVRLAPSFWGPLSDTKGRRFTFIGTFVVYLVANIGLAFSRDLASLMVFRSIQAAGSAATIAIADLLLLGAGVIGDITTAKERGGYIGRFGGIRMMGQSIGPVLGGVITELFGFRAIFWFLFALGATTLLLILFFLPETLRRVAGDGSVPLHGIHRPWIYFFFKSHGPAPIQPDAHAAPAPRITLASIFSPLRFLFEKDVFVTLFFGAVVYAVWSMVTSSTTFLFQSRFHLTDIEVGLVFLPNGLGCVAGSLLTGRLLDRDYRIVEAEYRARKQLPPGARLDRKELVDFPVARCRLRSAGYLAALFASAVGAYGFVVSSRALIKGARMAISLFLQFIIAYTATGIFTQNSALVVDLYPGASASATAVSNLMRCSVGAGGVALVQFIIDGIGAGATFLMLGLVTAALTPLLWFELEWGDQWRQERTARLDRERAAQETVDRGEMG
ncbi:MFS general substrate transporter, partial [Thozetella sp. PMI_491]